MFENQSDLEVSHILQLPQTQSNQRVVRKFINSAIYVERPVSEMPPVRKTSTLSLTSGSRTEAKEEPKASESGYETSYGSSSGSDSSNSSGSRVTVKRQEPKFNSELKLCLSQLNTDRTFADSNEKDQAIKNWLAKKETERKIKQMQAAELVKQQETYRQILVEKERQNFIKWLAQKKVQEEEKKKQKEMEEMEKELQKADKEKKKIEGELSFRSWLRRKQKEDLERKITEKIELIKMYEERQKRIDENERAYKEWIDKSKNKQKPIPFNRGLESLCSSASVAYINPIPWNAVKDQKANSL